MNNNCRVGKTYFKYLDYAMNIETTINKLSKEEKETNRVFIEHLKNTGKINELLVKFSWE